MALILGSGITKPQYPYDMWYGVQGDFTSLDYKLARVGNLDLHRTLPIQSKLRRFVENADGSVKYYLHQNDSRKKEGGAAAIIDSTDGNVMLEVPEMYFRLEISGTKWIYAISEYPLPGFVRLERKTIAPWYSTIDITNSIAVSGCFLTWNGNEIARDGNGYIVCTANAAQFRGGSGASDAARDGTYNSQLGMGRTSINKSSIRACCKNGAHIGVYRAYNTIAWLQRIEYASLHCQDDYTESLTSDGFRQGGLGAGCSVSGTHWNSWGGFKPFIPGGVTVVLGNNTGKVSYTVKGWTGGDKVIQVTSYRGLEVPYEYLWMLADDVLVYTNDKSMSTVYVCDKPDRFTSHTDNATAIPDGYAAIAELPREEGFIKTFEISTKGYSFPATIGGGGNKGCCDYFYYHKEPAAGWHGAILSAYAYYGESAGFGALNILYRSSLFAPGIGFRLCRN